MVPETRRRSDSQADPGSVGKPAETVSLTASPAFSGVTRSGGRLAAAPARLAARVVLALLILYLLQAAVGVALADGTPTPVATPSTPEATRPQADALYDAAVALHRNHDYSAALDKYGQALLIYHRLGESRAEATTTNDIGVVAYDAGQYTQALDFYRMALDIYHQVGRRDDEAITWRNIALAYRQLGNTAKQVDALQQALAIQRELDNRAGQAQALKDIGDVYAVGSQAGQALDFYQQALSLRREMNDLAGQAETLDVIASTQLFSLGLFPEALQMYQEEISIQRAAGNKAGAAQALQNIALAYGSRQQFATAIDFYQQSLVLWREAGDLAGQQNVLAALAVDYTSLGDGIKALATYQQAAAVSRTMGGGWREARSLSGIADTYVYLGQFSKALDAYEQAVTSAKQAKDATTEVFSLISLGSVYSRLGQTDAALRVYEQRALPLAHDQKLQTAEVSILRSIANLHHNLGEYDLALPIYQQALDLERSQSIQVSLPYLLYDVGLLRLNHGDYAAALPAYQEALGLFQSMARRAGQDTTLAGNDQLMACYTTNDIGLAYLGQGKNNESLDYLQQALSFCRATGDRLGQAKALYNSGLVYEREGDTTGALQVYQQALGLQEETRASATLAEVRSSIAEQLVDAYARAALLLSRSGRPEQAFDVAERARARTFLDELGNTWRDVRRTADAALAGEEQALRQQVNRLEANLQQESARPTGSRDAGLSQSLATQLAASQRAYSELLTLIRQKSPEYASLVSVSPLSLGGVQKLLDKDTTLLSYFVTTDATLAFVVTRDSFVRVEISATYNDLLAEVLELRDFASLNETPPSLERLYGWLIAPLRQYLSTPVIGVIPHSVLHYVPFAALTDGKQYLGAATVRYYLPSASSLPFVQKKGKSDEGALLAMANGHAEGLTALRYADAEVQAIAGIFEAQPLLGPQASVANFLCVRLTALSSTWPPTAS